LALLTLPRCAAWTRRISVERGAIGRIASSAAAATIDSGKMSCKSLDLSFPSLPQEIATRQ